MLSTMSLTDREEASELLVRLAAFLDDLADPRVPLPEPARLRELARELSYDLGDVLDLLDPFGLDLVGDDDDDEADGTVPAKPA